MEANSGLLASVAKAAARPQPEGDSSKMSKTPEQLAAENAELNTRLTTATTENTALKEKNTGLQAQIDALTKPDEELKVGDQVIKKSAVGDATFAALRSQQEQIKAGNDKVVHAANLARVEKEFAHLPGTPDDKAKALTALDGMSDDLKKTFTAMLAAGETAMTAASRSLGTSLPGNADNTAADAEQKLESLAQVYAKENKVSIEQARVAVLDTPEGRALYAQTRPPVAKRG